MILELAIEGISLNVFIFKPFSNKRCINRCGAYWRAALLEKIRYPRIKVLLREKNLSSNDICRSILYRLLVFFSFSLNIFCWGMFFGGLSYIQHLNVPAREYSGRMYTKLLVKVDTFFSDFLSKIFFSVKVEEKLLDFILIKSRS